MFERLSNRDKIILLILLIALVGYCFYHFILVVQLKAYTQVKSDLAESQAKLTQALAQSASLQSENTKLVNAKKDIQEAGKLFETEMRDGSSVILLGLDGICEGVDITDLEPGVIKDDPVLLEMPLKITAQGNYCKILSFCQGIENMINLSEVQSLKMEAVSGANDVRMTVNMIIFSAKTPQGRLSLKDISRWQTGRYNIFSPAAGIAPLPELADKIIKPVSPSDSSDSQPGGTGSVQGLAGESVPPHLEYNGKI